MGRVFIEELFGCTNALQVNERITYGQQTAREKHQFDFLTSIANWWL